MDLAQTRVMNKQEPEHAARQYTIPTLWSTVRDELIARRTVRAEHRRLARELAAYATPAERNDLNAILDTYPDADASEIRDLLNRSAA
jgi:hypothetical protein